MAKRYKQSKYYKNNQDVLDDWWMDEMFGNTDPDDVSQYVFYIGCDDSCSEFEKTIDFATKHFHKTNKCTDDYLPDLNQIMPEELGIKYLGQNNYSWDFNKFNVKQITEKLLSLGMREINENQL